MQIYCTECKAPQEGQERHCLQCGAPFGGETWIIVVGASLALFLPVIVVAAEGIDAILSPLLLAYELPVITATAFLYDYHPLRRSVYFWGGAAAILLVLWFFFL